MKTTRRYNLFYFTVLCFAFLIPSQSFAQGTWASIAHVIKEQGYAGVNFRLKAHVRADLDNENSRAQLFMRVDREENRGFFENMSNRSIKINEWKEYVIEGTFDDDYNQIAFGMWVVSDGKYYLDKVNLEIQVAENVWVSIYKTGFEDGIDTWKDGIGRGTNGINNLASVSITESNPSEGEKCLLLQLKGTKQN